MFKHSDGRRRLQKKNGDTATGDGIEMGNLRRDRESQWAASDETSKKLHPEHIEYAQRPRSTSTKQPNRNRKDSQTGLRPGQWFTTPSDTRWEVAGNGRAKDSDGSPSSSPPGSSETHSGSTSSRQNDGLQTSSTEYIPVSRKPGETPQVVDSLSETFDPYPDEQQAGRPDDRGQSRQAEPAERPRRRSRLNCFR
ncbi:hypothetical protein JCM5353_003630 [Sporobolomyces roseus]